MLVTEVRKVTDKKVRILFEDGFSFVLYLSEARKLGIREQEDLPEDTFRHVMDEILKKRSRLRCLNLLKTSDRSVAQLRDRLRRDGYPEETVEQALEYVASYHYTDDRRYAENYVRQMSHRKSRKQIEYELMGKGVDRETVRAALSGMEEPAEEAEKAAILMLARKRGYDARQEDREKTEKFMRYLIGKGYALSTVRSVLSDMQHGWSEACGRREP